MEYESEGDSTSKKGGARKRKEKAKDDQTESDFPCIAQRKKIKNKKKRLSTRTMDSTEDEARESTKKTPTNPATELIKKCEQLGKDVTESDIWYIQKKAAEAQDLIQKLEKENMDLKTQITEKTELQGKIDNLDNTLSGAVERLTELRKHFTQPRQSYAQKLKVMQNINAPKSIKPTRNLLTIFPENGKTDADSEETKKTLIASLAPAKEKLKIRSVRTIGKGGVMLETETKEDLNTLLKHKNLARAGLRAELPEKKKPLMIVFGIPTETTEEEFLTAVRNQNLEHIPKNTLHEEFALRFKTGRKDKPTANWVIEVSPGVREILRKKDRIFLDWLSCPIKDFIPVSRCYRCQSFGHVSKYCREKLDTCGHCGNEGHPFKDCPQKGKDPSCINCKRAGKPHSHSTRWTDCPAYKSAIAACLNRIDYGH